MLKLLPSKVPENAGAGTSDSSVDFFAADGRHCFVVAIDIVRHCDGVAGQIVATVHQVCQLLQTLDTVNGILRDIAAVRRKSVMLGRLSLPGSALSL